VLPDIEDNPPPSEITDAILGRTAAGLIDGAGCTAGVIDAAVERALNSFHWAITLSLRASMSSATGTAGTAATNGTTGICATEVPNSEEIIFFITLSLRASANGATTGTAVTNGTTGICAAEATNAGEIIEDVAPPAMELFEAGETATGIWAAEVLGAGDTIADDAADLGVGLFLHCPFAV